MDEPKRITDDPVKCSHCGEDVMPIRDNSTKTPRCPDCSRSFGEVVYGDERKAVNVEFNADEWPDTEQ